MLDSSISQLDYNRFKKKHKYTLEKKLEELTTS